MQKKKKKKKKLKLNLKNKQIYRARFFCCCYFDNERIIMHGLIFA